MNKQSVLLLLALLVVAFQLVLISSLPVSPRDIVVQNLKLYVEGKEFFIKAISYAPVPLGKVNQTDQEFGGAGFCSSKKTVFGEYKSACFGSDFFDGAIVKTRVPKGPSYDNGIMKPWWLDVWKRDFAKMKEMGVNTLRIYNLNPVTKTFIQMYPNEYTIKDKTVAADHTAFLNLAKEYGFKVILPIVEDQTFLLTQTESRIDKHIEARIQEYGNHDALLMWCLGNELDIQNNKGLKLLVNKKLKLVRERTEAIWGRKIPVTHAVVDDPVTYEDLARDLDVDVFTANAGYRDIHMEPLWAGEEIIMQDNSKYVFPGWSYLSKKYNKTLFVGEIGMHQITDEKTNAKPDWFNQQWKTVVQKIDDGCIGGSFFEYMDEPLKYGLQQHMGAVIPVVNVVDGKSSYDTDFWQPDLIVEKPFVYQAIKSGVAGPFKQYNFNSDVFELVGREPTTIELIKADPSVPKGASSAQQEESIVERNTGVMQVTSLFVILIVAAIAYMLL